MADETENNYHQARPGQKTVTMWELVDEKGKGQATNQTTDRVWLSAAVSPTGLISQADIKEFSEELYAVLVDKRKGR